MGDGNGPLAIAMAMEEAEEGEVTVSDDDDDFVVQRRDVKTGRPVTSGPVQYSVAETVPQPRCGLDVMML